MARNRGGRTRPVILAVDGGDSKTDVALLGGVGEVLGAKRVAVSSHAGLGRERAVEALDAAIRSACRAFGVDPDRKPVAEVGVFCLAGADLPVDERRIHRAVVQRGWTGRSLVRNDTLAILRAGTDRGWGVAIVCGSGMNCAGVGRDGQVVRFAALGEISGDLAAGGGWIGTMALAHATRAEDGRGGHTALEALVPGHFGLPDPRSLVEAIYLGRLNARRLVELAPVVFAAARGRDRIARIILDQVADEVVSFAATTIKRLGLASSDVEVILGGGVFRAEDKHFYARIRRGIRAVAPQAVLRRLDVPPVAGAALLGLDAIGAPSSVGADLRAGLTHTRLVSPDGKVSR